MRTMIRNVYPVSKRWRLEVEKIDDFGHLVGPPQTKYKVSLIDHENYDDPGHRTWYLDSEEELRNIGKGLLDFCK